MSLPGRSRIIERVPSRRCANCSLRLPSNFRRREIGDLDDAMLTLLRTWVTPTEAVRRLGTSLANHRASLSSELGSIWDFIRIDRDRRRSAPASYEPVDTKTPARLARDLLQVVQETVFSKKYDERRCPLVKEESDLSSEEGNDRRIANLIDFFFTIVKSQNTERKNSTGSCFKTESPTEVIKRPRQVNVELEKKMETLMEFLATTGCMENEEKDDKKITLMEFLFGSDKQNPNMKNSDRNTEITITEIDVNVQLTYIDETPVEEKDNLVDILIKYMENYEEPKLSITPCLSEKSKSDITISKFETFSDISKTKSDSTLTHTQDTVIEREISDKSQSSRRISETVIDLSNVKNDLDDIFEEAVAKIYELQQIELEDTMSDSEDADNFSAYTKPLPLYAIQCMPYSVELSDILEEDESLDPSSRVEDRMALIQQAAEDLLDYIEDKIQKQFESDSESEFDIDLKRSSISLIDLRSIPDLPPSMIIKPKVPKLNKSTSTSEISDSISELSRRNDSCCMTEDTSLTFSSEKQERALDKLESLHKFFSKSRLEIIDEKEEEKNVKKAPKKYEFEILRIDNRIGQASLDDVEDLQFDETDIFDKNDNNSQILNEKLRNMEQNTDVIIKNTKRINSIPKTPPNSVESTSKANKFFENNIKYVKNDVNEVKNDVTYVKHDVKDSKIDRKEVKSDDFSDTDFSEIDKIITDAIKIIISNELANQFNLQKSEDD